MFRMDQNIQVPVGSLGIASGAFDVETHQEDADEDPGDDAAAAAAAADHVSLSSPPPPHRASSPVQANENAEDDDEAVRQHFPVYTIYLHRLSFFVFLRLKVAVSLKPEPSKNAHSYIQFTTFLFFYLCISAFK